jgi:hypothetical protein
LLDPEQNRNQNLIHSLLESYIFTLRKQNVDVKTRKLGVVVVLSQADRLLAEPDFPRHIGDYVRSDPIVRAVAENRPRANTEQDREKAEEELKGYIKTMNGMSEDIEQYLLKKQPAAMNGMLGMAARNNVRLRYCLISALGHEPDRSYKWDPPHDKRKGRLLETAVAYRVLDPLFSALELERTM